MKKPFVIGFVLFTLTTSACFSFEKNNSNSSSLSTSQATINLTTSAHKVNMVKITDKPIAWSENRKKLVREYSLIHYGQDTTTIIPRAIVVHWTASNELEGVYRFFYSEETNDPEHNEFGSLNVASHFLVDRDGTIYRLTPETALNRHAIGLNWCSIGIENVGGENGYDNLTEAQLHANTNLIRYLKNKYPDIQYVFGHYQQDQAKQTDLWIEKIPDYYAIKIDPGPRFMEQLKQNLKNENLFFFE